MSVHPLDAGRRHAQPARPCYFDINLDILWQTVQEDLPGLIAKLEELVPEE